MLEIVKIDYDYNNIYNDNNNDYTDTNNYININNDNFTIVKIIKKRNVNNPDNDNDYNSNIIHNTD